MLYGTTSHYVSAILTPEVRSGVLSNFTDSNVIFQLQK